MRLHRMTLAAIGPFPDQHTIDFAALGASGLFLLEGPTGAGKSTVIDALVFALYGRPAGATAGLERLVSSHAAAGAEPFVDLVLETSAGIYRIRRSPEHTRPKQRGTGTTRQQATVRLWRLADPDDPGGEPLSTRVGEADQEIARIVGLSREQFVQTVVLPQGEFAAFLRASPDERRPLLQRLFGTDVYQRMQDHLAEAARTARRESEQSRESVVGAITAFVRAARDGAPTPSEAGTPDGGHDPADASGAVLLLPDRLAQLEEMSGDPEPAKVRSLVDDVLGSLRDVVATLERADDVARARADAARQAWEDARTLDGRHTVRAALLEERATIEAQAESWRTVAVRLRAATRAAELRPVLDEAARAGAAASTAAQALEVVTARIRSGADADLVGDGVDLAAAALVAATERGALDRVVGLERSLPGDRRGLAELAATERALRDRHEDLLRRLALRPGERSAVAGRAEELREVAARREACELLLRAQERSLHHARDAATAATELDVADADLARRAAHAARALETEAAARRRWIAGMAGELAGRLAPGEPCAVCGSSEHPAPAPRRSDAVTAHDVEVAEAARAASESALSVASGAVAALRERLRAATEASGGVPPEVAADAVRRAEELLARSERAEAELVRVEAELVAFDERTHALAAEATASGVERAEAAQRLEAARVRLDAAEATVEEAAGTWPSVSARAEALTARGTDAAALGDARRLAEATRRTAVETDARLELSCREAGFTGPADALAALMEPAERHGLQAGFDEHRLTAARVVDALAEPTLTALEGCPRPDVPAAEAENRAAHAAALEVTRAAERARTHLATTGRHAHLLDASLAAEAQVTRAAGPVLRMAALATAGEANERRTTLATYVLLRRFEDVVAAANCRLAEMSDGRFALARIDEREGGVQARKAGLGLVVEDHVTGDRRNPRTLSGGETFYVSLCLALGLADVVSAEAGGIDLGTLVIDEGFGSLDADTLDAVMAELARLRDGGRVVAIVSHVQELKQRIPERLEVRRRPDGASTLRLRV